MAETHNQKNTRPSERMVESDGSSYRCTWIEDSMTILADGTVTCGLDDPFGNRCFGNVKSQSISEISSNSEYQRIIDQLKSGMRCPDCAHFQKVTNHGIGRLAMPKRLVIEPTIRCNLRCPQFACIPNNADDIETRDEPDMKMSTLTRVLEQLDGEMESIYFFNYGEPFMNRAAPEMIAEVKARFPDTYVVTSTNGIPVANPHKAAQLAQSRLDHIVFTISGMTQESYARYHVRGQLKTALRGMQMLRSARREFGNLPYPAITWRYLVFHWTDSPAEIDAAISLAKELELEQFTLHLTETPPGSMSYRIAPGSPLFARYRHYVSLAHDYRNGLSLNGLYTRETLDGFGPCRWTSWQATMPALEKDGMLRLFVSTNDPQAAIQGGVPVVIRTPWRQAFKVWAPYCVWGEVQLPIPKRLQGRRFQKLILSCPDAWIPRDRLGSDDQRCLGVLVTPAPQGTFKQERIAVQPASVREQKLVYCTAINRPPHDVDAQLFRVNTRGEL